MATFLGVYNRNSRLLILILVLCLLVRLLFAWVVYPYLASNQIMSDDWPDSYALYAQNLLNGHGFCVYPGEPSIMRGPVYPLFGALIFLIFGIENLTGTQIVHAILDALTAILLFLIGNRIFNRRVGFVGAILYILYPLSIWYSARMSMVSLLTLLHVFLAWLVVKSSLRLSSRLSIGIGLTLGVITLTLPVTILFPVSLFLIWLIMRHRFARVLKHVILVCGFMIPVILPWTIRNYIVSKHFVPVSAGGGYACIFADIFIEQFDGFSPYSEQYPSECELAVLADERVKTILEEADAGEAFQRLHIDIDPVASSILNQYALESAIQKPLHFARKVGIQVLTFWYLGNTKLKTLAILLIQTIFLLPWMIMGVYFCVRKSVGMAVPLIGMILYWNLVYAATIANARHGMPAMPLALLIAAFGISVLFGRVRARREEDGASIPSSPST